MILLRRNICCFGRIIVYKCFSVVESKIVGLWQSNFNTIGKSAFLCVYGMRIFFVRSVFFMKKINSLENFFEIRENFDKIWRENRTRGMKASAWWKNIDSTPPDVFVKKNCLFFGERLSSIFFRPWMGAFWTLAKNFQPIVKVVFLSVQSIFFRRSLLLRKLNSLISFQ